MALGTLPMQLVTLPYQAVSGNTLEAHIVIRVSNPDGSAKDDIGTSARPNPANSCSLQTIVVPPTFWQTVPVTQTNEFGETTARQFQATGQLLLREIDHVSNGVYVLKVFPVVGLTPQSEHLLNWVAGDYVFCVSCITAVVRTLQNPTGIQDRGDILGVLTIR